MAFNAPGADWVVYYGAIRLFMTGDQSILYQPEHLISHIDATYGSWLHGPLGFHPWLYPPQFLLILLPFGTLGFTASYVLFEILSFAGMAGALWRPGAANSRRILALLSSPAAVITVLVGQNAFLSATLLIGGVRLLRRYPIVAGIAFGILTYKPQLCALIPVALISGRHWRTLRASIATCVVLWFCIFAVSPDTVRYWFNFMTTTALSQEFATKWQSSLLYGYSPYVIVLLLGAPKWLAAGMQLVFAVFAIIAVAVAFRSALGEELVLAILLAGTVLCSPHIQTYDLIFLAAAVMLIFCERLNGDFLRGEISVLLLAWILPFFFPIYLFENQVAHKLGGVIGMSAPAVASALILYAAAAGRVVPNRLRLEPASA